MFIVTLIHPSSELPLHYRPEALHTELNNNGDDGLSGTEVSLGLTVACVKIASTKKNRWDVVTGDSLLRGQKTTYAGWTHLFGKPAHVGNRQEEMEGSWKPLWSFLTDSTSRPPPRR